MVCKGMSTKGNQNPGYRNFEGSPLLNLLCVDLKCNAQEKLEDIIGEQFESSSLMNDSLAEGEKHNLKGSFQQYFKRFQKELNGVACWADLAEIMERMSKKQAPFLAFGNLSPTGNHIEEIKVQEFIEKLKPTFWHHAETKDRFKNIDWTKFQDDTVLFSNGEVIDRIKSRLKMIENINSDNDLYKKNPVSWSDHFQDADQLLHHPSFLKLNKAHFLLNLKKSFLTDGDFGWHFDFSQTAEIRPISRDKNLVFEWIENELIKFKPQFLVPSTKYKLARNHKEVFLQKWERLINDGFVEISPLANFIESNFVFDSRSIKSEPSYSFKALKHNNLKHIILEILNILDTAGVLEVANKREVIFWLYIHFNDSIEYGSIEYYVYHR